MTGIIYKYTSPKGKIYIGQTTDELTRRSNFLDSEQKYAGNKMETERKRCPDLNSWKYEVLYTLEGEYNNFRERLDFLEAYYIIKYDSIYNGLNTILGNPYLCDNRYFIQYYKKSDIKVKKIILHNIREEVSTISGEKQPKIYLNQYWDNELSVRDYPIIKGLLNKELKKIKQQLSNTNSEKRKNKLAREKNKIKKQIQLLN